MIDGEVVTPGSCCPDCGVKLIPSVCHSFAGYYIGTYCNCGPYSRETDYFGNDEAARKAAEYCLKVNFRGMDRTKGYKG